MAQEPQKYGSARTLCEFVTGVAYVMEASGGLDDGMSDRLDDLIEPVAAAGAQTRPKKAAGGADPAGLGVLRPKRARITE